MTRSLGRFALLASLGLATACGTGEAAEEAPRMQTAQVTRGDLTLRAEATGSVEPVREVEVKSKASGEILRLHADIGDEVQPGALLAEIDPRDVRNSYDQSLADLEVARARGEISKAQLDRSEQLFQAQVITQQEHENARLDYANAQAQLVKAETNFELAELRLNDVNIRAPMAGTIIQKNVEEGVVIQSASQNVSGGTALFLMADLAQMQVRTLVDETDMGELRAGLPATVRVEAFPDRAFQGSVQKIEPQATVEQNVTMFPVIVSLDNSAGLLKPGMNAEVEIIIDQAPNVLLVPNNAIVQPADVGPAAMALGLDVEALDLTQFMRAGRGTRNGGQAAAGGAQGGGGNQGGGARAGGGNRAAQGGAPADMAPEAAARMQELRAQVERGEITQDSMRAAAQALRGGAGFPQGARPMTAAPGTPTRETRPAVVFVMGTDSIPQPRLVQIGLNDWDNTEVVTGVEDGETLVVVGAAQLQAQQQAFLDQMRSRMGGNPFGGGAPGGGGGPGGGGRRGGG